MSAVKEDAEQLSNNCQTIAKQGGHGVHESKVLAGTAFGSRMKHFMAASGKYVFLLQMSRYAGLR